MEYRIDREALADFIARQVDFVEAGAIPKLLADVVELRLRHESVSRDEVRALGSARGSRRMSGSRSSRSRSGSSGWASQRPSHQRPITIRAASQVGNILKYVGPEDPVEPRYANYM